MEESIFYDIIGYEGLYQINRKGEIRGCDRVINSHSGGVAHIKGEKMFPYHNPKQKYYTIALSRNCTNKRFSLHRLLAINFIPNPENKSQVNHINGIKTDNRMENLEWATPSENRSHAYRTGLQTPVRGEKSHFYGSKIHLGRKAELCPNSNIIMDTQTGIFYFGLQEAANAKNLSIIQLGKKLRGERTNKTSLIYV